MTVVDALLRGLLAVGICAAGVVGLSLLEALWLLPSRGVLSTFARARAQLHVRSDVVDAVAGVAGLLGALAGPAVAAALVASSWSSSSSGSSSGGTQLALLAVAALLSVAPAPLFLALGAGNDDRSRLALHDALAAAVRRGLALLAVAVVVGGWSPAQQSPDAISTVAGVVAGIVSVVAAVAAVVLVRSRHRGVVTLQPRFEDRLAGPALIAWRAGDRAVVVVVAALAARFVSVALPWWPAAVASAVVVVATGVLGARALGPLRGEGLVGPVLLLVTAVVARAAAVLL